MCTMSWRSILAEPSHSLWFQTQLLCYVGFLLFVLWTIKLERCAPSTFHTFADAPVVM